MKTFNELREARQMKDPKKDSMVQKGGNTIVIDKSKEKEYLKKGWSLAESVNLDEGKMKEFHDYIDQGKSAQWIAKKMGLDMKTVKALMDDIKESTDLSEAIDFEKMSKELLKHKSKGIEFEKAAAFVRVMFMNSALSVQDKAMKGLLDLLKNMDDLTKRTTITKILKDNGFKVKGGRIMRESLEEDKGKFVVKYSMSKKGTIRTMPFNLLVYAKKFLADKEKEGYKGIISKDGKSVKESVELTEKTTIDLAREVVKNKSAKYGLDMQTANLIIQVYDKVNDKNKKKMEKMNPAALGQAVWKMTGNK